MRNCMKSPIQEEEKSEFRERQNAGECEKEWTKIHRWKSAEVQLEGLEKNLQANSNQTEMLWREKNPSINDLGGSSNAFTVLQQEEPAEEENVVHEELIMEKPEKGDTVKEKAGDKNNRARDPSQDKLMGSENGMIDKILSASEEGELSDEESSEQNEKSNLAEIEVPSESPDILSPKSDARSISDGLVLRVQIPKICKSISNSERPKASRRSGGSSNKSLTPEESTPKQYSPCAKNPSPVNPPGKDSIHRSQRIRKTPASLVNMVGSNGKEIGTSGKFLKSIRRSVLLEADKLDEPKAAKFIKWTNSTPDIDILNFATSEMEVACGQTKSL